ncbi:MAG TPA: M48 family metalloprotease [Thermoanaerobaculia bacterium]|nr:M48 family metalloprotease [Thermoanaerobaculia bacterium]
MNRSRDLVIRTQAAAVAAVMLTVVACSTNPATGKQQVSLIGEQQEIQIGRQSDQEIVQQMGLYPDEGLQRYVDTVGQRLAAESERPDLPWTFRVIDDPTVNAFALPGGFIYVTRGLLTHLDNEAELASVLGHEIGHVTARHGVERLSKAQLANIGLGLGMILAPELRNYGDLANTGLSLLFLKYGRDDERQADDLGVRYMVRENYDPYEMPGVFETLERVSQAQGQGRIPTWLSTHPAPDARAERIRARVDEVAAEVAGAQRTARAEYLGQVDGTVFGENPREGFFQGNTFYHPELAFQVNFPPGWKYQNQRSAVGAISPNQDAVVVMTLARRDSPSTAFQEFVSQQGIRRGQPWQGQINGMAAVSSEFQAQSQQGTVQGRVAFVEHGGQVFQILGYSSAQRWGRFDDLTAQAMSSFARVDDRRILNVQPRRIDIVRVPRTMTLREFARQYPSTVDLQTLAIINQVQTDASLAAGTDVKRVVGGDVAG